MHSSLAIQDLSPEMKMGVTSMEERLFMPGSELQKWFTASADKLDKRRLLQLPSPESMVEHCLALANAGAAEGKGGSPEVAAAESIKNLGRLTDADMILRRDPNGSRPRFSPLIFGSRVLVHIHICFIKRRRERWH